MPINAQNLLTISKKLLGVTSQAEEYFRVSSNRAYYCAFHSCSQVARSEFNAIPNNGHQSFGHEELYDLFLNHQPPLKVPNKRDKDIYQIGYLLKQARDLRVHADYKNQTFSINDAQDTINSTEEILRLIKLL
ncbi:hypothetical protein ACFORL_05695 [Legionella dresdenensis]|uniref:HEPN domain-containing protein n=1 Tax=Legionella dresdenensis TaxID=450200 RepID=A0ABV8CEH8_9GAMM